MTVAEFPGLQIDDFRTLDDRPAPSLCLLTHMHSDHLAGLDRQSYHSPRIYCSAATRAMVLNLRHNNGDGQLKYHHLRKEGGGVEVLNTLAVGVPHQLVCQNRLVQVTLIDAVHCPGATMFLVEGDGTAVLFTGDIRFEAWHVNALSHHAALLPYTLGGKPITLYIDNTFEQHEDQLLAYSDNFAGISDLLAAVAPPESQAVYPATTHFALVASTTGYEEVLIALALRLDTKIHLDSYRYYLYLAAADTCPVSRQLVDMATMNPDSARVHWCRKGHCSDRDDRLAVYLSPRVTMKPGDMKERNQKLDITDYPGGTYNDQTLFVHAETAIRYILAQDKHSLLPGHIYFNFSRHASLPEAAHFTAMFPKVTVKSLKGEPVARLAENPPVQELRVYKKKAWSRPKKRAATQTPSTGSQSEILDFLNQQARDESSLSTPPASPQHPSQKQSLEESTFDASLPHKPAQAGADCLEQRLRQDLTEWFNLEFDWKKQPIYGYK